jgi:hypothetical protein
MPPSLFELRRARKEQGRAIAKRRRDEGGRALGRMFYEAPGLKDR